MGVPFFCKVDYDDQSDTFLKIKNPGEAWKRIQAPFSPFVICEPHTAKYIQSASGPLQASLRAKNRSSVSTTGKPLSAVNGPQKAYTVLSWDHPSNISYLNKLDVSNKLLNNKIPFIWNISMVNPDFWDDYDYEKENINTVVLDIEQESPGDKFPAPTDPVTSVAAQYNDNPAKAWLGDECVKEFLRWMNQREIDMIITYNGKEYDLPVLSHHANFQNYWYVNEGTAQPASGLIHYDLMESVFRDQTLSGIKNKQLKSVVEWKIDKGDLSDDLQIIEVDRERIQDLSEDELKEYNINDVIITQALFELYFEQVFYLHKYLQIPLNQMFPIHDSFPAKILTGKIFWDNHIYMDGTNSDRYPSVFKRESVLSGDEKPFQGAHVEMNRPGRHSPVWHLDVSSMYPNIIRSLGIGPDNLSIVEWKDELVSEVQFTDGLFYVPDQVIGKTAVMERSGESAYAEKINEMYKKRLTYKGVDETIAYGLKIIMNSVYGLCANKNTRYGSFPVGMLITAVGRKIIKSARDYIGDDFIELDTDGIYSAKPVKPSDLEELTHQMMKATLDGKPVFEWDVEEYEAGLFYKEKNYLLLESNGSNKDANDSDESSEHDTDEQSESVNSSIRRYGVSMKGSHHPPMFEKIILDLGYDILTQGYTKSVYKKAKDYKSLKGFELEDFIQQRRMGKPFDEYDGNSLSVQLAKQYRDYHGNLPSIGENMKYLTCVYSGQKKEYILFERYDPNHMRIDDNYYKGTVDSALERLDIQLFQQPSIGDFT